MSQFDIGLLDVPGTLMIVLNRGGLILLWNRACGELTGYSFEEVRGRPLCETLLTPEGVESTKEGIARMEAGQRLRLEHHWVTKSGERRWIAWSFNATQCPDGQIEFIVGIGVDRTEDKLMEEALRITTAKLSGIIEIAADAIISVDHEERIVMFNEGAEQIFGYSRKEVLGQPLDMLMPERFRERHHRHIEAFAAGPMRARRMGARRPAIFGLRKGGEEFPAEAAISKLEVDGARLFTVVLRDITERRRVETEQRFLVDVGAVLASTLDYEETLASIATLAVQVIADWCVVGAVKDGQLQQLRVVHGERAKAPVAEALQSLPWDMRQPHLASRVLETGQPVVVSEIDAGFLQSVSQSEEHLRLLRELSPRSMMALPLIARGQLVGVLVLVSCRSTRRYGEQDLPLAEELARRAALAVDNARLYQSAQQAIRARDEVLGIVAHDLRNPLSTIQLSAGVLQRHMREDGRATKAIEAIVRSSQRADRLIRDLLDVSRIEAGRFSLQRDRILVAPLVADVIEAQSLIASAAAVCLHSDLPSEALALWGDRERLFQVFENLIGNAVRFTPAGGHITVGARAAEDEVIFWIADTGSGISSEHFPHIFDRFWQARKAEGCGAGLGLPICKGIVEAQGGRIWAESKPDAGSTFYFTVPIAPVLHAPVEASATHP